MKPTALDQLSEEHHYIETVINSLQDAAGALERGRRLDGQKLESAVEFLRVYADQRHHTREEGLLLPVLIRRGVPSQGCPIGGLNHEHEKARALVSAFEDWLTFYRQQRPGADQELRKALQAIVELYRKHLWMEDAMVFPMADRLLNQQDHQDLTTKFAETDRQLGLETIARLELFATSLAYQAQVKSPANPAKVMSGRSAPCGSGVPDRQS